MANVKATTKSSKDNLKYRAYIFAVDVVKYLTKLVKTEESRIIKDQLLRCGTSIGANIVEAQSGSSRKDFINFYSHALKSANETKFWLCLIRDSELDKNQQVNYLLDEATQLSNMLGKSILTLKGK